MFLSFQLLATILAPKGIGQYIRQHFLDKTFQGLYHANAFDMALLIPYFIVLILLASYGAHRYVLVYLYYKHKKNRTTEPPAHFAELPRVTVQLPIFNEQFVVERLLEAICRLNYPLEKLDIQVLDDSTDETVAVARGLVNHYAAKGFPVTYHHRVESRGIQGGRAGGGYEDGQRASSSPSSTPTSFRRKISCCAPFITSPIPRSAWCRPAGPTSIATIRF